MSWEIAPDILVRTTGFPVAMLARLRMPGADAAIRALFDAEEERDRVRARLLEDVFPPVVAAARVAADPDLKLLYDARRRVGRLRRVGASRELSGRPPLEHELRCWDAVLDECAARADVALARWEDDLETSRLALRAFATDPRVREAIAISNPSFLDALDRHPTAPGLPSRSNRERRFERRLALYAQRLCAKNETTSFFGPLNYGQVEVCPGRIELEIDPGVRSRRAYPAQWMAEALAGAIMADPALRDRLPVRRGTLWRREADFTLSNVASGAVRSISTAEAQLWEGADGETSPADLAAQLGIDPATSYALLEEMGRDQIVVAAPLIPPDSEEPLRFLLDRLGDVEGEAADRWRAALAEIADLVARLSDATVDERLERRRELQRRFVAATGLEPHRGAGEAYADRDLTFEESRGSIARFSLSTEFATELATSLEPLLRLLGALAEERRDAARAAAERIFEVAAGARDRVPFLRFIVVAARTAAEEEAAGPLATAVTELVRERRSGGVCSLTAAEVESILPPGRGPASCSVDLMFSAPDIGTVRECAARIVVGEVHPPALLHSFPAAAFNGAARHRIAALLDGDGSLAELVPARKTKIFPYPLPGPQIELRPLHPTTAAIPVAEVDVVRGAEGLRLEARGRPVELRPPLEPGGRGDVLLPFSRPALTTLWIDLGEETPRIEIDGVVVQRRRWRVRADPPAARTGDWERFLFYRRLAREVGLPDEIFVRVAGEPKPVAIDLCSQFGIELLDTLRRENEELVISEAMPPLDGAWLELEDGHHTSELRLLLVDHGPER
jgi:hypothetical protein